MSFVILKIYYEINQNITLVLIWLSYAPICLLISFFIFSHLAFQNAFVGLKNLGATCYVNTFLQVRQFTADMKKSRPSFCLRAICFYHRFGFIIQCFVQLCTSTSLLQAEDQNKRSKAVRIIVIRKLCLTFRTSRVCAQAKWPIQLEIILVSSGGRK